MSQADHAGREEASKVLEEFQLFLHDEPCQLSNHRSKVTHASGRPAVVPTTLICVTAK